MNMQNLRNKLMVGGAVLTLAVIGSVMNSRHATLQGAGGPAVTIDPTQLPLPVTGAVSAAQNGAWNVGITGTPTVTVGNTIHVLDAEKLARIPYQSTQFTVGGCVSCQLSFTAAPSGHRLVLQHISAQLQGSTQLALSVGTGLIGFSYQPSWTFEGTLGTSNTCGINQDLLGYFDPADGTPNVTVPGGGVLNGTVTLTGYLENCSITGCPAIQR